MFIARARNQGGNLQEEMFPRSIFPHYNFLINFFERIKIHEDL